MRTPEKHGFRARFHLAALRARCHEPPRSAADLVPTAQTTRQEAPASRHEFDPLNPVESHKTVVCRRSTYLAFSSGECLKIPRESVWRRVHVEGVRGVLFQAGPALLFYLAWRWRCPVVAELMATVKRVSVDPERG